MTKEQMRIVIAEACGWKPTLQMWNAVTTMNELFGDGYMKEPPKPNYPEDLNACHEMEKVLGDKQQTYTLHLISILNWSARKHPTFDLIHVTALQRCEAFIKTVCPERWVE